MSNFIQRPVAFDKARLGSGEGGIDDGLDTWILVMVDVGVLGFVFIKGLGSEG